MGLLIGLLFVFPMCLAAEDLDTTMPVEPITLELNETENETVIEELVDPGVSPDSPFYGLDRAMERLNLALTFNKAEKAKKGLAHANERLAEVQAMIQEKKMEQAQIAQEGHDDALEEVEQEVAELSDDDATEEMEEVVELSEKINEHRMIVEKVGNSLIKTKGELTEEQQNMIQEMLGAINGTTAKLKVEIQNKKEETKLKVKVQTGKSDAEVEGLVTQLQEQYQLENKGKSGVIMSKNEKKVKTGDDTDDVEETYQVTGLENVYQKDDESSNTLTKEETFLNKKSSREGLFETEAVFER